MRRFTCSRVLTLALGTSAALAAYAGCGSSDDSASTFTDAGAGDAIAAADTSFGDAYVPPFNDGGPGTFGDFPPTPIVDAPDGGVAAPGNSGQLFGPPDAGAATGGPCLTEPEIGTLYPNNWLRPRFSWNAANGENLFELRVHAANQVNDLVVYTASSQWTMPKAMWDALRQHSQDVAMTVSIRGGILNGSTLSGVALGTSGTIGIAPVDAPGSIVYWTTANGSSLKGFSVGDETVGLTLVPSQIKQQSASCLGCHTGTPDGDFAVVSVPENTWSNAIARVAADGGAVGDVPAFLGAAGKAALEVGPLGINATSKAHWSAGDHKMIASDGTDLVLIDLEAASGAARTTLARNGAIAGGAKAGSPAWSHDGKTIVYVATGSLTDGRLGGNYQQQDDPGSTADLAQIPYASGQGGAATAIAGASAPNVLEYYPAFSPDDAFLAFNEAPNGKNMYNQQLAEVFVIPSAGGTATRLRANDPPACSGKTSPGVTNSFPKWAPSVGSKNGKKYYWIVFSSTRSAGGKPQLFISPVVVDAQGNVTTHAALYLWNQPADEGNHTPAWEYFNIPPPPPPK